MCAGEWRTDAAALAGDGRNWRSVYGGARLFLGFVRIPSAAFVCIRLLLLIAVLLCVAFECYRKPFDGYFFLYFDHWVLLIMLIYFIDVAMLTLISVCGGSGEIARGTPFVVRVAELCYGALIPAAWIHFAVALTIHWAHASVCISHADRTAHPRDDLCVAAGMLMIVLADAAFSRQPYYASFHALTGLVFSWAWVVFAGLWQVAGGRNRLDQLYIERCLDWRYPLSVGGSNLEYKLLFLNWFVLIPLVNYVYWLLLWARRRTLTIYSKQTAAGAALLSPIAYGGGSGPTGRRTLFEYAADWRDLHLDGRHWHPQFGGSSGRSSKMGAYICCDFRFYTLFRFLIATAAVAIALLHLMQFRDEHPGYGAVGALLYFDGWVVITAAAYFVLAFSITAVAACSRGAQSDATPFFVWPVSAAYGALLPGSIASVLIYVLVAQHKEPTMYHLITHLLATVGICVLVLIDAWINRQPYYATFHAFVGMAFCWGYLLFNLAFTLAGGTDEAGNPYVYSQLWWRPTTADAVSRFFSTGKIVIVEILILAPIANALYWCMLWARRRARVAAKQSEV